MTPDRARRLPLLAWLTLIAIPAVAQEPRVSYTSEVHPLRGNLALHGEESWIATRVVDARTKAPIPAAELHLIVGSMTQLMGEFRSWRRSLADTDGFARLPFEHSYKVLVRAPGYAPWVDRYVNEVTELAPSETLPVVVRDWMDRPVSGALVSFCAGGGGSPDLTSARTDDRGLALLEGVSIYTRIRDLYVSHPDLWIAYEEGFHWVRGEAPYELRVPPGDSVSGVLCDPLGKPLGDAYVGLGLVHRGPWTRTNADGSFHLFGGFWRRGSITEIEARHDMQHVRFELLEHAPALLRLPNATGERTQHVAWSSTSPSIGSVAFRVEDETGEVLGDGCVVLVGPLPSRYESRRDADSASPARLPFGRYEATYHAYGRSLVRTELQVTSTAPAVIVLQPTRLPTVRVGVRGFFGARGDFLGDVVLETRHGANDISLEISRGEPIALPEEPFRFVLTDEHRRRRVFTPDREAALAAGSLELEWFDRTLVSGRVVDRHGAPARACLALVRRLPSGHVEEDPAMRAATNGSFAWHAEAEGLHFLTMRRDEEAPISRVVPVMLPRRGNGESVEMGDLVLDPPSPFVLALGGEAARGEIELGWWRPGWSTPEDLWAFPLDAQGRWTGPDLAPGDVLQLLEPEREENELLDEQPPRHDLRVTWLLGEKPPYHLRVPAGELLLDVRTAGPEPDQITVAIGAEVASIGLGLNRIRRVQPGPQRIFVSASDHQTAIVELDVPETGQASATVTLPRR
ncbi:MAG: hypothetical protein JNM84_04995 [Planctomycetes bacterium]|nr:hypothetical protein [Planctomycetota bacterium]